MADWAAMVRVDEKVRFEEMLWAGAARVRSWAGWLGTEEGARAVKGRSEAAGREEREGERLGRSAIEADGRRDEGERTGAARVRASMHLGETGPNCLQERLLAVLPRENGDLHEREEGRNEGDMSEVAPARYLRICTRPESYHSTFYCLTQFVPTSTRSETRRHGPVSRFRCECPSSSSSSPPDAARRALLTAWQTLRARQKPLRRVPVSRRPSTTRCVVPVHRLVRSHPLIPSAPAVLVERLPHGLRGPVRRTRRRTRPVGRAHRARRRPRQPRADHGAGPPPARPPQSRVCSR